MAAQTYPALEAALLAETAKAQPPYATATPPPDFAQIFPEAIRYAEGRIYRDLVLLATRQQNTALQTSTGSRTVSLANMTNGSGGPIIVPEQFALIVPGPATQPASGTRVPFDRADLSLIDQMWPTEGTTVTPSVTDYNPRFWALRDDSTIVYCPTANGIYVVELTGLFQPTPLSVANPTTYLSTVYPELLEAACMIYLSGAMLHNFGAQSENPQRAMSWEGMYQELMTSARAEERRRRGLVPDVATPPAPPIRTPA